MSDEISIRLLAVEDDPSLSFVLEEALTHSSADIDAVMACSLEEALDLLDSEDSEEGFELILLDLTLPDSDGLETFSAVHDKAAEVPIVVLTGLDDPQIEEKVREMGARDFLLKGEIGSKALIRKVRNVARGVAEPPNSPQQD